MGGVTSQLSIISILLELAVIRVYLNWLPTDDAQIYHLAHDYGLNELQCPRKTLIFMQK